MLNQKNLLTKISNKYPTKIILICGRFCLTARLLKYVRYGALHIPINFLMVTSIYEHFDMVNCISGIGIDGYQS